MNSLLFPLLGMKKIVLTASSLLHRALWLYVQEVVCVQLVTSIVLMDGVLMLLRSATNRGTMTVVMGLMNSSAPVILIQSSSVPLVSGRAYWRSSGVTLTRLNGYIFLIRFSLPARLKMTCCLQAAYCILHAGRRKLGASSVTKILYIWSNHAVEAPQALHTRTSLNIIFVMPINIVRNLRIFTRYLSDFLLSHF